MRISDWSSDVCSSDLHAVEQAEQQERGQDRQQGQDGPGLAPEQFRPDQGQVFHRSLLWLPPLRRQGRVGEGCLSDQFEPWAPPPCLPLPSQGEESCHACVACSTSVPLSRCSVWLAYSEALGSWVTMTMVLPCSRLSTCSRPRISSADWRSRSPVGSSQISSVGSDTIARRSEEHTSELQSLMRISDAVFCLKKKKQN